MRNQVISALGALSLLAARPLAEELVFEPAQGLSVTRTFLYTSEVALDDFAIEVDGEDLGAMLGEFQFEVESVQTIVVTDDYLAIDGDRITELRRTFDEIGGESDVLIDMAMGSESVESSVSSELEGASVLFTWDEDAGEYTVEAAEDSVVDERLLDGLKMPMDLSGMLPGAAVEQGDDWEVELRDLQGISFPGGDLGMLPDGDIEAAGGFDPEAMTEMMKAYQERAFEMLEEWVDGTVRAAYVGTREIEGARSAAVEVELDLVLDADISDLVADLMDELLSDMDVPMEIDVSFDLVRIEAETEGEGEMVWDLEGSHGRSLEMLVDYDFAVAIEVSIDIQGESHDAVVEMSGSGLAKLEVSAE